MKVYDASKGCSFSERKIFFDTNVYIFVDGFDNRPIGSVYSTYYWQVVKERKNTIVINDYVISEFFNRCCKDKHALDCEDEKQNGVEPLGYKARRATEDFIAYMETIRDSCLNFLDDATFNPACTTETAFPSALHDASQGRLDLSDIIIRDGCIAGNFVLVTDDIDYFGCGSDIVTANRRLLALAKAEGILA